MLIVAFNLSSHMFWQIDKRCLRGCSTNVTKQQLVIPGFVCGVSLRKMWEWCNNAALLSMLSYLN